jgi:hypothetical protein
MATTSSGQQPAYAEGLLTGAWYRHDSYVIEAGVIKPAPGSAPKRYDLWPELERMAKDGQRPYLQLVEITKEFRPRLDAENRIVGSSPENEASILKWVGQFGLLGLLLERVLQVDLHPRWKPHPTDARKLRASAQVYASSPTGWRAWQQPILRIETEVAKSLLLTRKPGVILRPALDWNVRGEALEQTWAGFFPATPEDEVETFDYPLPLTERFWNQYGEPIADFYAAAQCFVRVLDGLPKGLAPGVLSQIAEGDQPSLAETRERLNLMLRDVHMSLRVQSDGSFSQAWAGTTLLAQLSLQLLEDITIKPARLRSCAFCGTAYLGKSYQSAYCSTTHAKNARQRTYRRKLKGDSVGN